MPMSDTESRMRDRVYILGRVSPGMRSLIRPKIPLRLHFDLLLPPSTPLLMVFDDEREKGSGTVDVVVAGATKMGSKSEAPSDTIE